MPRIPTKNNQPVQNRALVDRVHELTCGFMNSDVVAFAVRSGLLDSLYPCGKKTSVLADQLRANKDALARVIRHLEALEIVARRGQLLVLTHLGKVLTSSDPLSLHTVALLRASDEWRRAWTAIQYSIRTGRSAFQRSFHADFFDYLGKRPRIARLFNRRMHAETLNHVPGLSRRLSISKGQTIVDVGGGYGSLITAIAKREKSVRGILLELESVIKQTRREYPDCSQHCVLKAGDFFKSIPAANILLLKGILHDWDDTKARQILRHCVRALSREGRLYVIERLIEARATPLMPTLRDLHMLIMTGGRERSLAEYVELGTSAGLVFRKRASSETGFSVLQFSKKN